MVNEQFIEVSGGHKIRVIQTGNPKGIPILNIHGGPGTSYAKPQHINNLDLDSWRVIQFDQRGCGSSTAPDILAENTTQDLVRDIEIIRKELAIDKWIVTGGSWGSTIALVYAETYPEFVQGLFVKSIFLDRKAENKWVEFNGPLRKFFPDLYEKQEKLLAELGIQVTDHTYADLYEKLKTGDSDIKKKVVKIINDWEGNIMELETNYKFLEYEEITEREINDIKIYLHYTVNKFFLEENQIIKNVAAIKDIPIRILHGRYDMACPLEQAYNLYKSLPNSKLEIVDNSGHKIGGITLQLEGYMIRELVNAVKL
jgi:proline iminopeptidase